MEHPRYLAAIREESEHFLEVLAPLPLTTPVPACPGWTVADLLWHVGEVQSFWSRVVDEELDGDDVPAPARPDDGELGAFAARAGTALLTALAHRSPDARAWTWADDGDTVGWIARRQAHEALVHRVDAELAAGLVPRPPAVDLAVDGVDEILRVMVHGVPGWGVFTPDGVTVEVSCTNAPGRWALDLGRFTGTSPTSGRAYDLDAAAVRTLTGTDTQPAAPDLALRGPAWDLDLWLWGRGGTEAIAAEGDRSALDRLRGIAADATQ